MDASSEIAIKSKATAWSVGVHILLLFLFIFLSYTIPAIPPIQELGMEVNLGTSEDGSGDEQPMSVDAPASAEMTAMYKSSAKENNETKDMMRSEEKDAPEIAPVNATSQNRSNAQQTNRTRSRQQQQQANANNNQQQRPRYVMSSGTGNGGNNASNNVPGTSEGNTTGSNDRGVPGGMPGSANYDGSPGNGTGGISHSLSGRDISPKVFEAEFNEGGKVVIRVTVNKEGEIISKSVKSSPSATLSRIALQKLAQARFTKSPNGEPQQFGEISILFRTRRK